MKLLLDFDDTIFDNRKFKAYFFKMLEDAGVPSGKATVYYSADREVHEVYSPQRFLNNLATQETLSKKPEAIYSEILEAVPQFVNEPVVGLVKKLGKEHCYIISQGQEEYQADKINNSGVKSLFKEIIIVPSSKKEAIENICREFPNEKIVFADDKPKFLEDLNGDHMANLVTVLFDENGFAKLEAAVNEAA